MIVMEQDEPCNAQVRKPRPLLNKPNSRADMPLDLRVERFRVKYPVKTNGIEASGCQYFGFFGV